MLNKLYPLLLVTLSLVPNRLRLLTPDVEHKVRITVAVTTLLLGPLDLGNRLIAREGMLEMMLVMANTDEDLQQKVS